jgi:hypothetical protein
MKHPSILRLLKSGASEFIVVFVATCVLILWRTYVPSNLLFDQFVIISVLILLLSFSRNYLRNQNLELITRIYKALAISVISSLLYFSTVQYTILAIDRSRSFYLLSWIDSGIFVKNKDQFILVRDNLPNRIDLDRANLAPINQRIEEQISRKLVTVEGSKLFLTTSGEIMLKISTISARIFNLNSWESNTSLNGK